MNTHAPQPDAGDTPAREHTTVIRSEQAVASVTFAEPDDGRWFRVLNSVIDRGEWASLTGAGRNVLIVLARHAGQDGTSFPDSAALRKASGLSKSALYEALGELERKAELIRRGPGGRGWVLFPRRPFATRKPQPTSQPGVLGQSATADSLHDLRRRRSAPADLESAPADLESAPADSPKSKRDLEGDEEGAPRENRTARDAANDGGGDGFMEAMKRLTGEASMSADEASRFIERFGLSMAVDSLDNALWRKRAGKLSGPVKAYAWHAAGKGYGPFREVRAEREAAEVEAAARELKGILDRHLDRQAAARVAAVFGSCRRAIGFGVVEARDVRTRDGADVARLVARAAAACEGHAPAQFKRVLADLTDRATKLLGRSA